MPEEYITITPENFGVKPRGSELPPELRMLKGYKTPVYVDEGLPEFNDWVQRTLATRDQKTIEATTTYLELKAAFYAGQANDTVNLTQDARIHGHIQKGLNKLDQGLEALATQ